MAANALANIAAATAAGYTLERTTLASGRNVTRLSKRTSGMPGKEGSLVSFDGEGATSGAADTAALANLNNWRNDRYGVDSAQASLSPQPSAATFGSHGPGTAPTHASTVKDRD